MKRAPGHMDSRPSRMAQKFLLEDSSPWVQDPNYDYSAFRKGYFFFYGPLTDPQTLQQTLKLSDRPRVYQAKITGYRIKLWQSYPALIDQPGAVVPGVAYEVQSAEHAALLEEHEPKDFNIRLCRVEFENGEEAVGKVFKWVGD